MDDILWKTFPGCVCAKKILIESGYDNKCSLLCLNEDKLNELEDQIGRDGRMPIRGLRCDHSNIYDGQQKFKILLGHRLLILKWCHDLIEGEDSSNETFKINHPAFSQIMVEIIHSALTNHNKTRNIRRFSDLLMQFSIYLYIMAGKACYEIICANLPLPKANTISTYSCVDISTCVVWNC